MRPLPFNPVHTAVIIVDLQKGYCDPEGDAAMRLQWNCKPLDEACKRHVPFLKELRDVLQPDHIIWARMEERRETAPLNLPARVDPEFVPLCVRGTKGFEYHVVFPVEGEKEVFKTHPSAFHVDARLYPVEGKKGANDSFRNSHGRLDDYLKSIKVNVVAFTGVLGSRCVFGSIAGASILGYHCVCLDDLVAVPGGDDFALEEATHHITRGLFYAYSMTSRDFLDVLRDQKRRINPVWNAHEIVLVPS